jgi:Uma2 family endonuclease
MQLQTQKRYYTPEEYLELEKKAEYKHEYRDGEIVPMTGGTTNHNKIALNFAANLKFGLRGQDYDIYRNVGVWGSYRTPSSAERSGVGWGYMDSPK